MSNKLSDKERYDCIKNCFRPDKTFKFPVGGGKESKKRQFSGRWLSYSKSIDGAFCLPSSLFAHSSTRFSSQHANLILKPIEAGKNFVLFFKRH